MEVERGELVSLSIIELVLELHPVQTQSMQIALQSVHHQQHAECDEREEDEQDVHHDRIAARDSRLHDFAPEHLGQLYRSPCSPSSTRMRQRQGPQTQIRSRVGHAAQTKLDGLDALEDKQLRETSGLLFLVRQRGVLHELSLRLLVGMTFLLEAKHEGLEEEHPGNGNEHHQEEVHLHFALRREEAGRLANLPWMQHEVDQHVDQLWRIQVARHSLVPVLHGMHHPSLQSATS